MSEDNDKQVEEVIGGDAEVQPQPEATSEVREGMSADDTEAAEEQGVIGSDPSWGPLGLDENEDAVVYGAGDSTEDPVVAALIQALRSGNSDDARNALAKAEAAGHNVSGDLQSNEIEGKRDLAALAAEAEEANEEAAEDEDES